MMLSLYKNVTRLSTPVLERYLQKRLKRGKEDPARTGERRGMAIRPRPDGVLIWCHAASVGESISLLSVVDDILNTYPDVHVLMTTGTVTSARLMETRLPSRAFHQYVPVDHPTWVDRFLNHWHPDMVIWSESELWPNILRGVGERDIPAILLNARMSEKTYQRWQYMKGFIQGILKTFHVCLGQNQAEVDRLKHLGAKNVFVSGNLKYAAKPLPFDSQALDTLRQNIAGRPVVLWASTHADEEIMAARVHQSLQHSYQNILTLVVPRHPDRGVGIVTQIQNDMDLRVDLRSQTRDIPTDTDIYVADTLGELGLFYRLCPYVVMGGSFANIGGHNPIEPAQCGCAIFFGPMFYNFKTIMAEFRDSHAVIDITDENDLVEKLKRAFDVPDDMIKIGQSAQAFTTEKANVVREIMGHITPLLDHVMTQRERVS